MKVKGIHFKNKNGENAIIKKEQEVSTQARKELKTMQKKMDK